MINIFIVVTYLFALIESILYRGFFWKHFLIDPVFLMSIVVTYIIVSGKNFYLSKTIFIAGFVIYTILALVDSFKYNNFVFSKFHIQPENFLYLIVFSLILCLVSISKVKIPKMSFLNLTLAVMFIYIFIVNITISTHLALSNLSYIFFHSRDSYSQKMSHYWGFFYDYMTFVKNNTDENSTIMIPPQVAPWLSSGNTSLVRHFLYPRKIIQGDVNLTSGQNDVNYILVSYGEWPETRENKYGWPKSLSSYKNILYMDNTDQKWGLIKLEK